MDCVDRPGEGAYEAELSGLNGAVLLKQNPNNAPKPIFRKSESNQRRQNAKSGSCGPRTCGIEFEGDATGESLTISGKLYEWS